MGEWPAQRLILVHKQKTSARVRFLRFGHGMCAFAPLPPLSVLLDEPEDGVQPVVVHPAATLREAEMRLGLEGGKLKAEPDFRATVQTPGGDVAVHLATIETVDPPFDAAAAVGGRFIAITEARGCAPVEMELLRRAYTVVLG